MSISEVPSPVTAMPVPAGGTVMGSPGPFGLMDELALSMLATQLYAEPPGTGTLAQPAAHGHSVPLVARVPSDPGLQGPVPAMPQHAGGPLPGTPGLSGAPDDAPLAVAPSLPLADFPGMTGGAMPSAAQPPSMPTQGSLSPTASHNQATPVLGAVPTTIAEPASGMGARAPTIPAVGPAAPGAQQHPGDVPLKFTIPREAGLLPEPPALFDAMGLPTSPRDPPIPSSTFTPYWLEGKHQGEAVERAVEIADHAPGLGLAPTHAFATVPDKPPEKPPEKPPGKPFLTDKIVAMSGQQVDRSAIPSAPATPAAAAPAVPQKFPDLETAAHQPSATNFYWIVPSPGVAPNIATPTGSAHPPAVKEPLGATHGFDVHSVRKDFPILAQKVNGKPLVWLDNAATTQKPRAVIDRMVKFYEQENSNVHRAAHELAARATDAYEHARNKVKDFLGARSVEEIVFTRGTTESINLVAKTWARQFLEEGDEMIVLEYEHHSNIVPWQMVTREKRARLRVAPILDNGEINLEAYERLFNSRTRLVALGHVSNALGTVAPLRDMIATAHRHGAIALVDGAQSVPHFPINVQELDADFLAFSGHKLFAPTGIGVLWARKSLLDQMPPWQGGGNMIENVTFEHTTYNPPPSKFEAGTASLAPAVGLGAAIEYLERIGFANAARYEDELLHYGQEALARIPGVKMIGTARHKAGVLSFVTNKLTPAQMGEALNKEGIAVRVGHHCAQPALAHFGLKASIRPSIAFYNTHAEIDHLVRTVREALKAAG